MIEVILQLCNDESCWIQHEKEMKEKYFRCKRLDKWQNSQRGTSKIVAQIVILDTLQIGNI